MRGERISVFAGAAAVVAHVLVAAAVLLAGVCVCVPGPLPAAAATYRIGNLISYGTNALVPSTLDVAVRLAVNELTAAGAFGAHTVVVQPLNLSAGTGASTSKVFFQALAGSAYLLNQTATPPVDIVVGPLLSSEATTSASVFATTGIAQCSFTATAAELSDKALYPFFTRVTPSSPAQARALAYLCDRMSWRRVGLISTTDAFGTSFVNGFSLAAKSLGISIVNAQAFATGTSDPERLRQLVQLVKDSGVWIVLVFLTSNDWTNVAVALRALDMHVPPYQIVYQSSVQLGVPAGGLGFDIFTNTSAPRFRQYSSAFAAMNSNRPPTLSAIHLAYDSAYLTGYALSKYIAVSNSCPSYPAAAFDPPLPTDICSQYLKLSKAQLMFRLMTNTTFAGVTGAVQLDANGDRVGRFWITNSRNASLSPTIVGTMTTYVDGSAPSIDFTDAPVFGDGTTDIPLDHFVPRKGDAIPATITAPYWVLAFGISVLGAWTALILIEQAVWNYGHVSMRQTLLWVVASATALTIGLWSSVAIGLTAPSFALLPDTALSYKAVQIFCGLLVAWPACVLAFCGMVLTLRRRNAPRSDNSALEGMSRMDTAQSLEPSRTQQQYIDADTAMNKLKDANAAQAQAHAQRKEARSCDNACCRYSKQTIPWALSSASLSAGIAGVHFLMFTSIDLAVHWSLPEGFLIAGLVVAYAMGGIALAMFFHFRASRYRWFSAFVMAAAIDGAHFIWLGDTTYTYSGAVDVTHDLDASIIQIIAAVLTCIACFVFIGLNVIRLRLSKDVLDRFLIQAQKKIRTLEVVAQHRDHMLTERDTLLQLIAGVRPLVRPNHPLIKMLLDKYGKTNPNAGTGEQQPMDEDAEREKDADPDVVQPIKPQRTPSQQPRASVAVGAGAGAGAMTLDGKTAVEFASLRAPPSPAPAAASVTAPGAVNVSTGGPTGPSPSPAGDASDSYAIHIPNVPGDAADAAAAGAEGPVGPMGPAGDETPAVGAAAPAPGPSVAVPISGGSTGSPHTSMRRSGAADGDSKTDPRGGISGAGAAATATAGSSGGGSSTPGKAARRAAGVLGSDAHPDSQPQASVTAKAMYPSLPQPSRAVTFADILANPVTLEIFKDAVAANHNSENVAFLLDCEQYRRAAEDGDDPAAPQRRRVLATDIGVTYFGAVDVIPGVASAARAAPHAINIAATARDQVLDDIRREKFTPKLFDAPYHEVRRLLERNDFARFVETPAFALCGAVLVITGQLQNRLALGAAQARGKAAEILENSILKAGGGGGFTGASGGRHASSNLFGGSSKGSSKGNSGAESLSGH